ncbi:serine/threonine-protein phosphatase 6 regulatory ankyrin repeat subunit B [Elysia marginata]|uniref:Serine/threonine-protein phosphatase 6 regulatory ankyrin repeat subunit B n=1 Tax=Elysia marginata TaxID=1093978 RepID=A0AAV4HHK7_9GAST|nr:serine/threonine-protein phosphatase 6 regulatory ankyrin repeat subunit B [Elysia marginata]
MIEIEYHHTVIWPLSNAISQVPSMENCALAKAIEAGEGPVILDLLKTQSDPDALDAPGRLIDSGGRTLFHAAAQSMPENVDVLKALVSKGVDPAARDYQGVSGMDVLLASSADSGSERVATAVLGPILEQGDLKKLEDLAMKGWALEQCSPKEEALAGLLENVRDKLSELIDAQIKQAAVSRSILEGSEPVEAEHLKQLGPLVAGLTSDGMSLLHQAVICQRPDIVDTILAVAPDSINSQDYTKRCPLHYAAMCPPGTEIYQTLKNAGANEALKDLTGKSSLDYASEPNTTLLEEMKAKIEQRLRTEAVSPGPAAEGDKPETADEKTSEHTEDDVRETTGEDMHKEPETQISAAEAKTPAGPKQIKPLQVYVSRHSCRRDPPVPPPTTVDGRYIAQHLGEALTRAMAEIAEVRPWDPIEYLARWLYKYRRDDAYSRKQEEILKTIRDEEARLIKEEELKFKRMEELRRYQEQEAEKKRIEEEERKKKEQEELLRSAKESALAQKPALPTVSEEAEENANDDDDDGEEDDDTSVKDRDSAGQTELHKLAAQQGVDFTALIQLGYSIADRDINGKTARDIAQETGQKETVQAIDDYLKKILEDGREDVLEQLVLDGFDGLETVDRDSLPEVTKACLDRLSGLKEVIVSTMKSATNREEQSETEAVEAVTAQPLLVKAKDEAGRSLMHLATLAGAVKLVTHLASNFPDSLKARDNMKKKPAFYKTNSGAIKALQASLGLSPPPLPIPEVTIGEVEHTSADSAADDTAEEAHLATVMGADMPSQQTAEVQQEQQEA